MINIDKDSDLELYQDWNKCLNFLNNLNYDDYKYPKEVSNFHIYSEIKTEKELLSVKSFLATQNLDETNLVLWSDYDIKENKFLEPYKDLIDFRVYSNEESKGTTLENYDILKIKDIKYFMKSGILRFLVTNKYGGVWCDMDMVLLRDFKPILDQEWAYVWGSELDFVNFGPCAAMMNFKKKSKLSELCLEEILNTTLIPDSTVLDHVLLAKVFKKNKFTVFPCSFFNTEWQMNSTYVNGVKHYDPNGIGTQTEKGWFTKNEHSDQLFLDAFAWHWHNSSHKDKYIEKGSKFHLLNNFIDDKLKQKGII